MRIYIQGFCVCSLIYLFLLIPRPATPHTTEEALMQHLMFREHFAYTAFGAKAMSLTCFWDRQPAENIFSSIIPYKLNRDAYECWEKIKHKYQSRGYIFKESKRYVKDIPVHQLFFINKRKFIKVVNANLSTFRRVLGQNCTAKSLLLDIENSDKDVLQCLGQHEGLLGILLGYGKKNALAFHRRDQCINQLEHFSQIPLKPNIMSNMPSSCHTPEKMKEWLYNQMTSFVLSDQNTLRLYFLKAPQFVVLQSNEDKRLVTYYQAAHEKISARCRDKEASEIMLKQLNKSAKGR